MARRNPPAKWVLPNVVDPPSRVCFSIEVPNNIYHIAAFRGALLALASATKWQDDAAHTAKDVADVWKVVVDNVTTCPPNPDSEFGGITLEDFMSQQIRINPDDSCIIQMWCIDHWENWYDPRECISTGASQPGPAEPPALGECQEYFVTLNARDKWLLPSPVSEGTTITVSAAAGGWNDGTAGWNCPTGQVYILATCGIDEAGEVGDPIPSVNHMRLIGQLGVGGPFFDAMAGTYTVAVGVSDEQVTLQANDSTLSDNQGSISFKVTVCNEAVQTWCYEYDLVAQSGLMVAYNNAGTPEGVWAIGRGWQSIVEGSGNQVTIKFQFDVTNATHFEFDLLYDGTLGGGNHADIISEDFAITYHTQAIVAGAQLVSWTGTNLQPGIWVNAFSNAGGANSMAVTRVKIEGQGTPPNGLSNC